MKQSFPEWWGEVNRIHRDAGEELPLLVAWWGKNYYEQGLTPMEAFQKHLAGPDLTPEEIAEYERQANAWRPNRGGLSE